MSTLKCSGTIVLLALLIVVGVYQGVAQPQNAGKPAVQHDGRDQLTN